MDNSLIKNVFSRRKAIVFDFLYPVKCAVCCARDGPLAFRSCESNWSAANAATLRPRGESL